MAKIDSFQVDRRGTDKPTVRFLWGDLTKMAAADAVDILVVSCLPDDYAASPGTLVDALDKAGISLKQLAEDKAKDYRPQLPCWISKPVKGGPGTQFKRILVFEPKEPVAEAVASVPAIFQALACFYSNEVVRVATPLVCTGYRKAEPKVALSELAWAAARYASSNTTKVTAVNIVTLTEKLGKQLVPTFRDIKGRYGHVFLLDLPGEYDTFVDQAKEKIDHKELPTGLTYRQALAVCIYTTDYYKAINSVLYKKKPTDPEYREMLPLIEAIDSGLWNMKRYPGKTYRGDKMSSERLGKHQVGAKIANRAYTSTSRLRSVAEKFAKNAFLDIDGRTGVEVWDYSVFPAEEEVLFQRDFTYQVATREEDPKAFWNFTVHEILTNWCGGSRNA
ncbi:ADP-ribosyltransferase domain-containing protein [Streptomyces zagrosensis]|uniref:NAD(+)--protein-arginine ADP-ribosyltransferase n=1 Tax=Streptomyces zagrosensis TaxID=1042984 RepID=A0A7W9QGX2_9ACTN|nr:ADP-ribosyltransferase domain-containing protein [Streptomyces zagrosensis]MBB5939012.1 hypothetical protein [Streptomyces zagrosensis]